MRIGIVGNRLGWERWQVWDKLKELGVTKDDVIISGGASGVDHHAYQYAQHIGATMVIYFPDPDKPSPKRYFDRNLDIAKDSAWVIAFDKGSSSGSGTQNTINHARNLQRRVTIINDVQCH